MTMWQVKKMCLSCKYFRLVDELSGICRVDKSKKDNYPRVLNEDLCDKWKDCGQQYYIRTGWIKARKSKGQGQGELEN